MNYQQPQYQPQNNQQPIQQPVAQPFTGSLDVSDAATPIIPDGQYQLRLARVEMYQGYRTSCDSFLLSSIVGGIQPRILRTFFRDEYTDSGLIQRFIFAWPPTTPAKLTREGIGSQVKTDYAALLRRLQQLPYEDVPSVLPLSEGGWDAYHAWYEYIEEFKESVDDTLRGVSGKLQGTAVRLAGVLQLVADAYAMEIDAEHMRLGVLLARWFLNEWCRVHDLQQEPDEKASDRRLVDYISQKFGGRVAPHQLASAKRSISDAAEAEAILRKLEAAGWGRFEIQPPGPQGGQPATIFVVTSAVMS